jgi:hypothetical protein
VVFRSIVTRVIHHASTSMRPFPRAVRALRGERAVPNDRLLRVLNETDLIKFAQRPVTADRAQEIGREARAIVAQEHAASQPAAPAEKAA